MSTDSDMACAHVGDPATLQHQDVWLAKVDSLRNKIWFECLEQPYDEGFASLQYAIDSGFIMSGWAAPTVQQSA